MIKTVVLTSSHNAYCYYYMSTIKREQCSINIPKVIIRNTWSFPVYVIYLVIFSCQHKLTEICLTSSSRLFFVRMPNTAQYKSLFTWIPWNYQIKILFRRCLARFYREVYTYKCSIGQADLYLYTLYIYSS